MAACERFCALVGEGATGESWSIAPKTSLRGLESGEEGGDEDIGERGMENS